MQPMIMIPDDNMSGIIAGIQHAPKMCVDYLSHEWTKEDDIWTSWKVMSKQKNGISNGPRLENASWRTWAKQKYNLKTVDPKKLNWLKDSDVTWLYGPLHTAAWSALIETSPKLQTTEDKLNLMQSSTKSCLKKKKSMSEILRPIVRGRYGNLVASNSDTQLYQKEDKENDFIGDYSDSETASTCSSISGPTTPTTGPTKSILVPPEKNVIRQNRKIQFNDCVEQCIVVESDDNDDDSDDSDNSSDGGIVLNLSPKKKTIHKLAPTTLKEDRNHSNEFSSLYSNNRRRNNNNNNNNNNNSSQSQSSSSSSSSSSSTSSSSSSTSSSSSSDDNKSWRFDDDDDILDLDLIDIDYDGIIKSKSSSSTFNDNKNIYNNNNNNYEEDDDEDDGFFGKIVNNLVGRFF